MLKSLMLWLCCMGIVLGVETDVSIKEVQMANGDENEMVSIDLKKKDGSEDIILMAQLRIHLNNFQVHINGHPIVHGVVNSIRMRVSIMEFRMGVKMEPRLAPATFRVLVSEKPGVNGNTLLIAELEFTEVERYAVVQVDVKQIMWEGMNRRPVTSISFQESMIHQQPHSQDHHIFVPDHDFRPHLPSHGFQGKIEEYYQTGENRIICWFNQLSLGGKIAILCSAILTFLVSLLTLITCWKRHFSRRDLNVPVPLDNHVEVDVSVANMTDPEKKVSVKNNGDEFHMEINSCEIDVDDKKPLVS